MRQALSKSWLRRALALSVCATLAWACDSDTVWGWSLANRRDHALEVWARPALGCAQEVDLSDERSYGPANTLTVPAQDHMGLDWLTGSSEVQPSCGAVWLRVEDELDLVIAWSGEATYSKHDDPTPYSLLVEGPRDHLRLTIPDAIEELPPPGL